MRLPGTLPFLLVLAARPLLADKELKPIILRIQPRSDWTLTVPAEGNGSLRGARLEDVTGVQGKPIPAKPAGTDFKLPVTWTLPRAADDRNPAFVRLYLKVPDDKDAVMASLALTDKNHRSRLFLLTTSGSQAWAATAGAPPSLDGKAMDLDAANAVVDRADAKSAGANLIIFGNEFR